MKSKRSIDDMASSIYRGEDAARVLADADKETCRAVARVLEQNGNVEIDNYSRGCIAAGAIAHCYFSAALQASLVADEK